MKCELKNRNQAEYRKDRITLVCIFILVFSLVGILSTFASSPTPESSSFSSSSDDSDASSASLSDTGESPSGSSAQ